MLNCRIVIPESLKNDVLKRIHDDGHFRHHWLLALTPADGKKHPHYLPILPQNLQPAWPVMEQVRINDSFAKTQSANSFNKRKGAWDLPVITNNQPVRIRLPRDKE